MAWRFHCQRCGAERHGYASEELVEIAMEAHFTGGDCLMTPDGRLYADYHEEEPDGKGGWRDVDEAEAPCEPPTASDLAAIRLAESKSEEVAR